MTVITERPTRMIPSTRRVRARLAGIDVADSTRAVLVKAPGTSRRTTSRPTTSGSSCS